MFIHPLIDANGGGQSGCSKNYMVSACVGPSDITPGYFKRAHFHFSVSLSLFLLFSKTFKTLSHSTMGQTKFDAVKVGTGEDLVTLTRWVIAQQQSTPEATGDLTLLLTAIQFGCKFVASKVKQAGLINL